jgi:nitrite reductase/ring-hydroxylating ferredoxin subunit
VSATAALVADLLGHDPDVCRWVRPTVEDAVRAAQPGQVVAARDGGALVAVAVLADGRAYAVEDRCPHDGGWLSDGFVEGDRLVCARHGWEVDPCTGRCDARPRDLVDARLVGRVGTRGSNRR